MNQNADVVVNGYYGAGNAGDEAILESIIDLLRQYNANITVASSNPERTSSRHNVRTIPEHHMDRTTWRQTASTSDHVIIGGGGLIESKNITDKWLNVALECQDIGCPLHFLGVGVTPPTSRGYRYLYKKTLNRASSIVLRDRMSYVRLQKLGIKRPMSVKPDLAFHHVTTDPPRPSEISSNRLLVVLRDVPWLHVDLVGLAKAVQKVNEQCGCDVHVAEFAGKESDRQMISEFENLLREVPITKIDASGFRDLEHLAANSRFVIGMRLHSIVFAAKHGVPFLSIAYNPKCQFVPELFGYENVNWCVDIDPDLVATNILDSWDNIELRECLARRARSHHQELEHIFDDINSFEPPEAQTGSWKLKTTQRIMQLDHKIRQLFQVQRPSAPSNVVPTDPTQMNPRYRHDDESA